MRLAIYNWTNGVAGGAETYLAELLPLLRERGIELALIHELDAAPDRPSIASEPSATLLSVARMGLDAAMESAMRWKPDLVFAHGPRDPAVLERLTGVAPAVHFVHNHIGACISGARTHRFPAVVPCDKRFGWGCWLHFLPRRCGGLNPWVAWRLFRREQRHFRNLMLCHRVVTHSSYMGKSLVRLGLPAHRVEVIPFMVVPPPEPAVLHTERRGLPSRLLFLSRMDELKGGSVLIRSLPSVHARLKRNLHLTFAGSGPAQASWAALAGRLTYAHPGIEVVFTGWVDAARRRGLFLESDLVVMPSLWPEPFGQSGLEAGFYSVPTAAFQVGGIGDWLEEGRNGHLAPGTPPTVDGLASAITRCLEDEAHWRALGAGAREASGRLDPQSHVARLLKLFEDVLRGSRHT